MIPIIDKPNSSAFLDTLGRVVSIALGDNLRHGPFGDVPLHIRDVKLFRQPREAAEAWTHPARCVRVRSYIAEAFASGTGFAIGRRRRTGLIVPNPNGRTHPIVEA
ncbi:hypothetical protein K437DRAFT_163469 [Tilletiaria anomala UBC 951]|uniref:Uncharacterized protein n=1 Tax=Tilletiaria anomala (strain ATCC 24038 / CBS 436.72 / UBC 951) TaxID=1037660 RepID=A0A066WJL3_TILAU|nr:uncharacterized protein K437DRAFT_163469 [Tilletiaria anomala UBC 951]KDN52748.1 hypothetical protein K437DRAFT_163469 [Tilletiaria anomala UBC 951]